MILFITTPKHSYTVESLVERTFGASTPRCYVDTYHRMFRAVSTPKATHIFTDMERLYEWELGLAAELYRSIRDAGLPCLNDPARVMCRYELLRQLHKAGINPHTAYRAVDQPRPARFPVFVRFEGDHGKPVSDLLPDQAALDSKLAELRAAGVPLRGAIAVEYAGEPIAPGIWQKFGTFRVGNGMTVDHAVAEDSWLVKYGKKGLATDEMFEAEKAAVLSNQFAEELRTAFEIAGIEYGRADHATCGGRQVIYEVNTNPSIDPLTPQSSPIRDATLQFARQRMARHLWDLDFGDGARVPFQAGERLREYRRRYSTSRPTVSPTELEIDLRP